MDEQEFQRVLDLFPLVRSRDFHYADTEASRRSIAQPAQSENWQDALSGEKRESTDHKIDQLDTFWVKLQTVAEKKVGAAEAKRFCEGFQKIYEKLLNKGLSLDAARILLSSSNNYGE